MLENYFSRPSTLNRLRSGPIGSDVDDLATALQQQGYAWASIRNYVRGCDQFARWLSRHGYAPQMSVKHSSTASSADCRDLLAVSCPNMLRGCPICSSSGASNSVCPSASRTPLVRRPTTGCFDTSSTWIRSVASPPALVITIGVWPGVSWRPVLGPDAWIGHPYKRSRSLTLYGKQRPTNMAGGDGFQVPPSDPCSASWCSVAPCRQAWKRALAPRQWSHASIPHSLTAQEVEQILALYAGPSPTGLRHRAILMLLARLGLRAHEIVSLSLEAIKWQEAHLVIRARKTHHERVLPLLQDVGATLAEYLCWGRPATTSRALFLHCKAPFRPFSASSSISYLAARAFVRVGVTGYARRGAHGFRHSAASHMVNGGASFKDVADVLGPSIAPHHWYLCQARPRCPLSSRSALERRCPMTPADLPPSRLVSQPARGVRVSDAGRTHPVAGLRPVY